MAKARSDSCTGIWSGQGSRVRVRGFTDSCPWCPLAQTPARSSFSDALASPRRLQHLQATTDPHKPAGSGLITDPQFLAGMPQLAHQLIHHMQIAGDHSVVPDFPVAPCFRKGDGDVFDMGIKARIQYFLVYMWWVGYDLSGSSDRDPASFPERADRPRKKQPAIHMQPAHHSFFSQPCCASILLTQAGPQP